MSKMQKLLAFVSVPVLGAVAVPSFAAVPAAVTTALGDASTDSATVAGLALAIVIGIYGFKAMRRAL